MKTIFFFILAWLLMTSISLAQDSKVDPKEFLKQCAECIAFHKIVFIAGKIIESQHQRASTIANGDKMTEAAISEFYMIGEKFSTRQGLDALTQRANQKIMLEIGRDETNIIDVYEKYINKCLTLRYNFRLINHKLSK